MELLTRLSNPLLFFGSIAVALLLAGALHVLLERSTTAERRERAGITAAAYMTALGSLFAILTGFMVNSEYTTLRNANSLVSEEVAAASRIAWAAHGLPAADVTLVQSRLAAFLSEVETREWPSYRDHRGDTSPAIDEFAELQSAVATVTGRPYAPPSSVTSMQAAFGDLTMVRSQLTALSEQPLPGALFLLCVLAGVALIANSLIVSMRHGRGTTLVALGIVVIVALDLGLIVGISAPFQGAFVANRSPIATLADDVSAGRLSGWMPMAPSATTPVPCDEQPSTCIEVGVGEPIELGALLWLSAGVDGTGADSLRGVELAIDYLDGHIDGRDGTVLGHPVQLTATDEECSEDGGREGSRALLSEENLVAAIGPTCSGAALGAADVLFAQAETMLVSPSNTAPGLTDPATGQRFYARTIANDRIQGAVDAEFLAKIHPGGRVAVVTVPSPYSSALAEVFSDRFRFLGGTVVAGTTAEPDADAAQLQQVIERLAAAAPDAIFAPVIQPLCGEFVRAVRADPRLAGIDIVVGDACMSSQVLGEIGSDRKVFASALDNTQIRSSGFYRDVLLPGYKEHYGFGPTGSYHANAFDAVMLVVDAITRSAVSGPGGALTISRADLRRALLEVHDYPGASGTLTCSPTGDCAPGATIGVFRAPAWPVGEGAVNGVDPVFSQKLSLAQLANGG